MNNSKSVGIWIRVSTEDQAKGESPEHHEKFIDFWKDADLGISEVENARKSVDGLKQLP